MHALIRPRAKSIDEAPVGYYCSNGAAFVQHRAATASYACTRALNKIERFEKVPPISSACGASSPVGSLLPRTSCVENRAGPPVVGPSAGCEGCPGGVSKVSQGRPKEQQTAPWRHKAFQQR